jgi:oligosaccharide repeat unit polymerase
MFRENPIRYRKAEIHSEYLAIRLAVLSLYIVVFILLFTAKVHYFTIFWSTLVNTSICLWYGPIALISKHNVRKFYDPSTLFNLGMFYYVIKGMPLAWGEIPKFLYYIPYQNIVQNYPLVAIYLLLGIIAWNLSYNIFFNRYMRPNVEIPEIKLTDADPLSKVSLGITILTIISLSSFFILIYSLGNGFLIFITNPAIRSFLADASFGSGISHGYFSLYGIQMMSVASILWLTYLGIRNKKPNLYWWLHALVSLSLLLLVSPRATILSFVLAIILIYHITIKKIKPIIFVAALSSLLLYSSYVNLWRRLTGTFSITSIWDGFYKLSDLVSFDNLVYGFVFGTNLADIRIFILIEHFFGRTIPLKYGETLLRIVTQWVPRSIWSSKPYDLGIEIAHLYLTRPTTGSPPGYFAEMFLNFHFIGVIVGGFFLGYLLARVYSSWLINKPCLLSVVAYSILAPRIFLLPSTTIANFLINFLILLLGAFLAVFVSNSLTNINDKNNLIHSRPVSRRL